MVEVNLAELLKAGAHFGHKSSRWHPKIKPYIFGHRNNIHIFDLEKTEKKIQQALEKAAQIVAGGGTILFVGTKKQAKKAVKEAAIKCDMPYVVERWLGGTFTNFRTIQRSMRKLQRLRDLMNSDEIGSYTKKERLMMEREMNKLEKLFSGLENMKSLPEAIFVLSSHHDQIAVKEANKMKIPVIAVVDSNADPDGVDYMIPGNDDALQAIALYASKMAESINEARRAVKSAPVTTVEDKKETAQAEA